MRTMPTSPARASRRSARVAPAADGARPTASATACAVFTADASVPSELSVAENERLLKQCSDAELVARGATLLRLEVADLEPGFGGRLHATLRPTRGGELPQHRFGPGDVVAMRSARDDDARVVGVLVRVRREEIVIALECLGAS